MIKTLGLQRDPQRIDAKPAEPCPSMLEAVSEDSPGLRGIPCESVTVEPHSRIVFHTDARGLGADRFRFLRLRLREVSKAGKLKSVLITSPLPQDGKSTVALNLATALAERGDSAVLLLEADLHHPTMADLLGLKAGPGLAECLASGLAPFSVLRRVAPLGFYLLPAGKSLSNSSDLLCGEGLGRIMQTLSPHFNWIVIDSPPVTLLTDALALARHAEGSLLVVRAGRTPSEAIEAAVEALGPKHVLGVVLNGVEGLQRKYAKYSKYYGSSSSNEEPGGH